MNSLDLSKSLGLTPKTHNVEKPLFYCGVSSNNSVYECTLLEQVSENPAIVTILINDYKIDIAVDYLKEMQKSSEVKQFKDMNKYK